MEEVRKTTTFMTLSPVIYLFLSFCLAFQAAAYEDKARRLEIDLETAQKENQVISEQVTDVMLIERI